jgi:hypothetical protein
MFKRFLLFTAIAAGLSVSSCKSNSEDPEPKKEIAVNPPSANVSQGGTVQLSLSGNAATEAVTWSLDKPVGTISQTGLYTAPATISASTTVTVTATLQSDNSVKSSATLNVNAPVISFSSQIQPILNNVCSGCHSGSFPSGNYRTNSYTNFMAGGRVTAGDPDNSLVYQRLTSTSAPMPPVNQPKPSAADIELIKNWISQGALNN